MYGDFLTVLWGGGGGGGGGVGGCAVLGQGELVNEARSGQRTKAPCVHVSEKL